MLTMRKVTKTAAKEKGPKEVLPDDVWERNISDRQRLKGRIVFWKLLH